MLFNLISEEKIFLNPVTTSGDTPFLTAVNKNDLDTVKNLLNYMEFKKELDIIDHENKKETALYIAINEGKVKIANEIISFYERFYQQLENPKLLKIYEGDKTLYELAKLNKNEIIEFYKSNVSKIILSNLLKEMKKADNGSSNLKDDYYDNFKKN